MFYCEATRFKAFKTKRLFYCERTSSQIGLPAAGGQSVSPGSDPLTDLINGTGSSEPHLQLWTDYSHLRTVRVRFHRKLNGPLKPTEFWVSAGSHWPGSDDFLWSLDVVRRPVNPEAVHAGVVRVAPVGQNLDLDDLEGLVVLLLTTETSSGSKRPGFCLGLFELFR